MLSRNGRLIVVLGCVLLGFLAFRTGFPGWWLFPLAALGFTVNYWRSGPVWLAAHAARRGDFQRVERLLGEVRTPERLAPQQRAYYHYYQGLLRADRGDPEGARRHFSAAATGRLRTRNDRSLAHLQLAALALDAGEQTLAREHLDQARAQAHKPEVAQAIASLEEKLAAVQRRVEAAKREG